MDDFSATEIMDKIILAAYRRGFEDCREQARLAVMQKRFGPPSLWGGSSPAGWHLERSCTPVEAAMHDNGCVDAMKAIRALTPPDHPDTSSGQDIGAK